MTDPMTDQTTLTLPQQLVDEMIAHAQQDAPNECCGIIARAADGALTLYRTTNAEASPWRFNIPPQELLHLYNAIEHNDGDMLVIYHSHVASEARPSPTDLNIARLHRGPNPWPFWVLVTLMDAEPGVRAWRIDEGAEPDSVVPNEIALEISETEAPPRRLLLETIQQDGRPRVREREL